MANTAAADGCPSIWEAETEGVLMPNKEHIAQLVELLKMEAEKWPGTGKVSESELLRRDQVLLEMWPEACRRTGSGVHEFPSDVIKLWQKNMGRAN